MTASRGATPETDGLHVALVQLSEQPEKWIAGKDYIDMREHARRLERQRDEAVALLRGLKDAAVSVSDELHSLEEHGEMNDFLDRKWGDMSVSIEESRAFLATLDGGKS